MNNLTEASIIADSYSSMNNDIQFTYSRKIDDILKSDDVLDKYELYIKNPSTNTKKVSIDLIITNYQREDITLEFAGQSIDLSNIEPSSEATIITLKEIELGAYQTYEESLSVLGKQFTELSSIIEFNVKESIV